MATDTRFKGSFKRAALFIALGACFSGAVHAQSNATGSIFGSSAAPGTSIVIRNLDTGLVREVSIDANGRYSASALPVGRYSVSAVQDGQTVAIREDVLVRLGSGSEVSFAGAMGDSATLDAVVVAAGGSAKPIDVSSVDTRVVFTAEQLKRIPVGRSIEAIALLTPGVINDAGAWFFLDTHVQMEPSAEQIAEATLQASYRLKLFGIEPKVALLSHSNYGSHLDGSAGKMRQAFEIIRRRAPKLEVDGEMMADTAWDEALGGGFRGFQGLQLKYPDIN